MDNVKIHVIGVGGCGANSINQLQTLFPAHDSLAYFTLDCDPLYHLHSQAPVKLFVPAEQRNSDLQEVLAPLFEGADLVVITAGLGGETGGVLSEKVANLAKSHGILTLSAPILPYSFEGKKRVAMSQAQLARLAAQCDGVFLLENDESRLFPENSAHHFHQYLNERILKFVQFLNENLSGKSVIGIDFSSIRAFFREVKFATLQSGKVQGDANGVRARTALQRALVTRFRPRKLTAAVVAIRGGADLTVSEFAEVRDSFDTVAEPNALLIFNVQFAPNYVNELEITLLTHDPAILAKPIG